MSKSIALVQTLKKCLKMNEMRYADVAKALDLSEASVKRLFAEGSFSLKRLDQICDLLGLEITDLVDMMRQTDQIRCLSIEQEKEIVSDLPLLVVANSALNRWSFDDILSIYRSRKVVWHYRSHYRCAYASKLVSYRRGCTRFTAWLG